MVLMHLNYAGLTFRLLGDLFGCHYTTINSQANLAANEVLKLEPSKIAMPGAAEASEIARGFAALRKGKPFVMNVIGCLDGTFIFTRAKSHEKRWYIGYKHAYSSLLLIGVCDHTLRFRWVSALNPGSMGDQGVMLTSNLHAANATPSERSKLFQELDEWQSSLAGRQAPTEDAGVPSATASASTSSSASSSLPESDETPGAPSEAARATICPGYVLLADGGLASTSYMLCVGTTRSRRALKAAHPEDADAAGKLEYADFIISSSRIHVERAFGRLFGMWRRLRLMRTHPKVSAKISIVATI